MIHYSQCPVCAAGSVKAIFSAKDHTVSQKEFSVWYCDECELMFTQDVPGQEQIGAYYASENYISHSDTQEGIINKLYHLIRKRTLNAKKRLMVAETGNKTGEILDIGCGTGAFLFTMQQAGWKVKGLEPDETARAKARSLYNIEALPPAQLFELPKVSYNAITMWHVLEHVHQLHEYVEQLKELLAVDGRLFIAVPNYKSYDARLYKENWAAYDVPRHLYHFSPKSMKKLMSMHGLDVVKEKPMWFDSFYVSMLSEQYRNGKGNIIAAFMKGLLSNASALFNTEKCSSVIYIISKSKKY